MKSGVDTDLPRVPPPALKIRVDQNIRAARKIFLPHGDVEWIDGRRVDRKDLADADVLIIRSVTRVNAELLEGTPVRFVGTTTIGTDHLDIPWLESNGIQWVSAPGCNADSAAQYTVAMIWLACERLGRNLADLSAGIIGRGNVGSRMERLLNGLGVASVSNDPPLADRGVTGLVSLEEALERDIVCLHVPLERGGDHPTYQLMNTRTFACMRAGALLVNTARGDVVDEVALAQALDVQGLHAVLDVWPGEPHVNRDLVDLSCVATPHVAGYSDDGKQNGAMQVYRAFCAWAGQSEKSVQSLPEADRDLLVRPGTSVIAQALDAACFVRVHDQAMRRMAQLTPQAAAIEFDRMRRNYPARRDFRAWRIRGAAASEKPVLRRLGFSVADKTEL